MQDCAAQLAAPQPTASEELSAITSERMKWKQRLDELRETLESFEPRLEKLEKVQEDVDKLRKGTDEKRKNQEKLRKDINEKRKSQEKLRKDMNELQKNSDKLLKDSNEFKEAQTRQGRELNKVIQGQKNLRMASNNFHHQQEHGQSEIDELERKVDDLKLQVDKSRDRTTRLERIFGIQSKPNIEVDRAELSREQEAARKMKGIRLHRAFSND